MIHIALFSSVPLRIRKSTKERQWTKTSKRWMYISLYELLYLMGIYCLLAVVEYRWISMLAYICNATKERIVLINHKLVYLVIFFVTPKSSFRSCTNASKKSFQVSVRSLYITIFIGKDPIAFSERQIIMDYPCIINKFKLIRH